jgi:hypothetical protein
MNTLYECKLGLKDYNQEQFEKYKKATGFQFIYLIGTDCVVDMNRKKLYSTVPEKYSSKILQEKGSKKKLNFLEETVCSFSVVPLTKIEDAFQRDSEELLVLDLSDKLNSPETTESVGRLLKIMKKTTLE